MRKVMIYLSALCLWCGLAVAQSNKAAGEAKEPAVPAQSTAHGSGAIRIKDAVEKMEHAIRQSLLKGDTSTSDQYLADDYYMFSGTTGQSATKKQAIDRVKSGSVKYSQIDASNEDVSVFGNDVAIAHGETNVKLTVDGKEVSGKYRYSRTWVKRNGKWQAVWFQSTKME